MLFRSIFLHGLPGVRSKQNLEIAEAAARRTGATTQVLMYSGLGHAQGEFNFLQCVRDVEYVYTQVVEDPKVTEIQLVGHSWGGYLAIRLAKMDSTKLRKIILMSPLVAFPSDPNAVAAAIGNYAKEYPHLTLGNPQVRASEMMSIRSESSIHEWIGKIPETVEVLFLQATGDQITPLKAAEEALRHFKGRPVFELVATDHSFVENRPQLTERIAHFMSDHL